MALAWGQGGGGGQPGKARGTLPGSDANAPGPSATRRRGAGEGQGERGVGGGELGSSLAASPRAPHIIATAVASRLRGTARPPPSGEEALPDRGVAGLAIDQGSVDFRARLQGAALTPQARIRLGARRAWAFDPSGWVGVAGGAKCGLQWPGIGFGGAEGSAAGGRDEKGGIFGQDVGAPQRSKKQHNPAPNFGKMRTFGQLAPSGAASASIEPSSERACDRGSSCSCPDWTAAHMGPPQSAGGGGSSRRFGRHRAVSFAPRGAVEVFPPLALCVSPPGSPKSHQQRKGQREESAVRARVEKKRKKKKKKRSALGVGRVRRANAAGKRYSSKKRASRRRDGNPTRAS